MPRLVIIAVNLSQFVITTRNKNESDSFFANLKYGYFKCILSVKVLRSSFIATNEEKKRDI